MFRDIKYGGRTFRLGADLPIGNNSEYFFSVAAYVSPDCEKCGLS
jgi:hypothetical protein